MQVLAEWERGEDVAVAAYRNALDEPELSGNVAEVLQKQYVEVKAAHDRVRALRDASGARQES